MRFLDNFSAGEASCHIQHTKSDSIHRQCTYRLGRYAYIRLLGTRGATSAEYFLRAGYAVIFMHRQFSLQPFSRHYSHSTNPFLDFLELEGDGAGAESSYGSASEASPSGLGGFAPHSTVPHDPAITVHPGDVPRLRSVLAAYKAVHRAGMLHTLTFVTVNEYLWLLRAVSRELSSLGRNAMYYLAAAVSDFFLPREKMVSRCNQLRRVLTKRDFSCRANTRFNLGRAVLSLKWTRSRRF